MDWGRACRRVWQRHAVSEGRATRAEHWWPVLVNVVIPMALPVLALAVTRALVMLYAPAGIITGLALTVRRLHDPDRSGWGRSSGWCRASEA